MDILVEKNGRYEPKPIVLDRRTEGQKKVTTTKFVLLLFCLKKVSPVLLFLAGLVGGGEGWAAVRLPKLVGDRMVLQRETELKIWGWADPGEKVTVRFRDTPYYTEADGTGKWHVMLPPQQPGGPFLMEVNEKVIRDVLVGDVYLCGGQSNQETPIERLVEKFPEIPVSNNHMIRHYKVPSQDVTDGVREEIAGDAVWHSATASEVMNWTSLAYFFATEVWNRYHVPVGMLVASKGGTDIESWISQERLKDFPRLLVDEEAVRKVKESRQDKGSSRWNQKDFDDSDWAETEVPGTWDERGIRTKGSVWYRKTFDLPSSMVGRHARIYMGRMADGDSVFVNGRLVGTTSYFGPPRKYDIPAGVLVQGKNNVTLKLTAMNGHGEIVPDKPYVIRGDEDSVSLCGTWKYKTGFDRTGVEEYVERLRQQKMVGSGLYNGMIYPIRDWKVRGAIWYQGENNAGRAGEYAPLLKSLIADWRESWQMPDMPFLLVQLPNYMKKYDRPTDSGWARLREAQLQAASEVSHTALAVTYDVGEWNDIHPLDKKSVAQRLFLGARKLIYGEKVVCSGPIYKGMEVDGDRVVISFTEVGRGLASRGGGLKHFAVAGEDRKFVWADAVIRGNKVIVSSKDVKHPVAVRYAWSDNPSDANLCNKDGLLAAPFRTDNW